MSKRKTLSKKKLLGILRTVKAEVADQGWILSGWDIDISRDPPEYGDTVDIAEEFKDFRLVRVKVNIGRRNDIGHMRFATTALAIPELMAHPAGPGIIAKDLSAGVIAFLHGEIYSPPHG